MIRFLKITVFFALLTSSVFAQNRYPIEDSMQKESILNARTTEARADEIRKMCDKLGNQAASDNDCVTFYPLETMVWGKGFYEGLAKITVRGRSGFINARGIVVIKPTLRDAGYFSEGMAPFEDQNGKWGFIDKQGKIVIAPVFDWAMSFSDGLALVQVGELWGYTDHNGKIVISPKFEEASSFSEGFADVGWYDKDYVWTTHERSNGKWQRNFIDKLGKLKFEKSFDIIHRAFDGGIALVSRPVACPYKSCSETDAVDKNGLRLWTLGSWYISWLSDDVIVVAAGKDEKAHDLYNALGRDGKPLFGQKFSQIGHFSEGIAPAKKTWEGKYGFVNKLGEFVIEDKFPFARSFSEGLAAVDVRSQYGYIDKNGNIVISPQFEYADQFQEGFALVAPSGKEKDKTGYIDRTGKYIWKPTK